MLFQLFYHHHLLQRLKSMYGAIVSPPPPEGEVPPGKADPKVPPKGPKEKKEAEAKKGKQLAVLEEPSSAGGEGVMGGGESVMM